MASYNGYYVGGAGQTTQGGVYRLNNSASSYIKLGAYEYPTYVVYTGSNWYVPANAGAAIGVDLTDYETGTKDHELIPTGFYEKGPATIGGGSVSISGGTDLCGKTLALRLSAGNSASLEGALQLNITTNIRTFTVTWKNDDGTTLKTESVAGGSVPSYSGTTPTKASTAQYSYSFSGWNPVPAALDGNKTYTAQYTATTRSYTVTWKDWDGTTIATETKAYGTTPSRSGPSRASTAQYNYTFAGWSPTPTAVTGNAVYTATYTQVLRSYTITWQDYDGTVLATETKAYGTTPSREGPSRQSTAQYSYTFAGWNPSPTSVTGNAVYTATYTQSLRSYTIVWQQDDGTLIDTTTVAYGEVPTHADAVKAPDVDFTYTFSGWSPTVVAVTGAATYRATYTATPNHRTVKYYDGMIWIECIPFVWNGTEWDEVEPYYYNGTDWVLCSQG